MNILNGQNLFTTLHLQRYWSKMAIFVPGRRGSGLNILIEFGIDKAEWCGYSYLRILHIGRHRCWRGLCVFGGLCVDMWRLVHQWSFLLFWQKRLLVYQSSQVYQDCTNIVPTVYQSSKTVKRQSKEQKWPLVYQSSHVYTKSAEYTKSSSASASAEYTKPTRIT